MEIWGTIPSPPPVPADLAPTSGDGQIALSWTVSAGATLHHLKRSTTSSNGYTTTASEAGGSYLDTNVTNGTMYYYVVSAESAAGESADSAEVSAVPSALINPDDVVVGPVEISPDGSECNLSFTDSVLGHNYHILAADDLASPDWQVVSGTNSAVLSPLPISSSRKFSIACFKAKLSIYYNV